MPMTPALPAALAQATLDCLGVAPARPSVTHLDQLIEAYARTVPWESASRIARRKQTGDADACPRWPEEFWESALAHGTGGTCFESNYAFLSLLASLGYDGYLTVNDMGQTHGCHTAIVLDIDGERWLADAGFPVYAPLRLGQGRPQPGRHHTYTLRHESQRRWRLLRDRHPNAYCFTLIDELVPDATYRAATTADYGPHGLFLDRVIITKVIDGAIWRYTSEGRPPCFESFRDGRRSFHPIAGDLPGLLAHRFGIDEGTLRMALEVVSAT